ncbi:MAG: hypothetical protein ACTHN0_07160 [Aquihabitans sp.]
MDGRRLLHGVIDVTRLVLGGVVVVAATAWAVAGARAGGTVICFALGGYLLAVRQLDPARRAGSGTPRWNALAYLGAAGEAVIWGVIGAGVLTVALGVSGAGADPWSFAVAVGGFLGVVFALGTVIFRRISVSAAAGDRDGHPVS